LPPSAGSVCLTTAALGLGLLSAWVWAVLQLLRCLPASVWAVCLSGLSQGLGLSLLSVLHLGLPPGPLSACLPGLGCLLLPTGSGPTATCSVRLPAVWLLRWAACLLGSGVQLLSAQLGLSSWGSSACLGWAGSSLPAGLGCWACCLGCPPGWAGSSAVCLLLPVQRSVCLSAKAVWAWLAARLPGSLGLLASTCSAPVWFKVCCLSGPVCLVCLGSSAVWAAGVVWAHLSPCCSNCLSAWLSGFTVCWVVCCLLSGLSLLKVCCLPCSPVGSGSARLPGLSAGFTIKVTSAPSASASAVAGLSGFVAVCSCLSAVCLSAGLLFCCLGYLSAVAVAGPGFWVVVVWVTCCQLVATCSSSVVAVLLLNFICLFVVCLLGPVASLSAGLAPSLGGLSGLHCLGSRLGSRLSGLSKAGLGQSAGLSAGFTNCQCQLPACLSGLGSRLSCCCCWVVCLLGLLPVWAERVERGLPGLGWAGLSGSPVWVCLGLPAWAVHCPSKPLSRLAQFKVCLSTWAVCLGCLLNGWVQGLSVWLHNQGCPSGPPRPVTGPQ